MLGYVDIVNWLQIVTISDRHNALKNRIRVLKTHTTDLIIFSLYEKQTNKTVKSVIFPISFSAN